MSQVVELDGARQESERSAAPICQAAVVSPSHDAPCQFASGVPSEAIATQRPIVATDFPRARQVLATGIGLLVPPRFPRRRRTPSAES